MGRSAHARAALAICAALGAVLVFGPEPVRGDPEGSGEPGAEFAAVGHVQPGLAAPGLQTLWGPVSFQPGLKPVLAQRWEGIVRQRLDAGCGPASLATLYTHYLGLPITEREMARALTAEVLRRGGARADIRRRGYSLGDLKRVAEQGGLVTRAFRVVPEQLHRLRIPVITRVEIRGYGHFVVLRGVVGNRIVVADPNFGNLTFAPGQFSDLWSGVLLAVGRPKGPISKSELDPREGPVSPEVDHATFGEGPPLPEPPLSPQIWFGARATLFLFDEPAQELFVGTDNLAILSLAQTELYLNLD